MTSPRGFSISCSPGSRASMRSVPFGKVHSMLAAEQIIVSALINLTSHLHSERLSSSGNPRDQSYHDQGLPAKIKDVSNLAPDAFRPNTIRWSASPASKAHFACREYGVSTGRDVEGRSSANQTRATQSRELGLLSHHPLVASNSVAKLSD